MALGLQSPLYRYPDALRDTNRQGPARLVFSQVGTDRCLEVDGRSQCRPGPTAGLGWATFLFSEPLEPWAIELISALWVGTLSFFPAFWARSRTALWSANAIVAASLLALPSLIGLAATPALQVAGAAGGIVAGRRLQRVFGRARSAVPLGVGTTWRNRASQA
jgi:hypothetical protein